MLMAEVVAAPARLRAEYELYLPAARRPELCAATRDRPAALAEIARRYTGSPARVRLLAGVVDGMLLQALLTDEPPTAERYEAALRGVPG
ncbi:hypothetical protein [Streptomyces sp. NPDC018031]|uniref:hypothetical protein n=1 Tax=Streptomyces sp. NPDC018031 TaxID=3365033 RepID=UPI0037A9E7A5